MYIYECSNCKIVIYPHHGDCCVFCSYGTVPCPSIQIERIKKNGKKFVYIGLAMFVLSVISFAFSGAFFEGVGLSLTCFGIILIISGILSKVSIRKYPILRKFFVSGKFKK